MTRVVSVYLPSWATDRHSRKSADGSPRAEQALVLVGSDGRRRVVVAANLEALRHGLRVGIPVAKAQVLVPGLQVENADQVGDAAALERLAFWALRYTPVVAADLPDGIVMDVDGAANLMGGEEAVLADLQKRFAATGYVCRVAIADSWGTAHALARFGAGDLSIAPARRLVEELAPLPVAALRIAPPLIAELRGLGFDRVSDILSQPRAPLSLRFGPELWRRIDQATGQLPEPIDPVRLPDVVEVRRSFADPIGAAETIKRYIGKLVADLCDALEKRGLGVRRLDLICHRVDSLHQAIRVGTAMPTRDRKRLTRMLSDKIETVDPGFGIEVMTLAATAAQSLEPSQSNSNLIDPGIPDVSDLVDILANRVGGERLYRVASVASDVPERSTRKVPALAEGENAAWTSRWPRPTRLLERAEPIDTVALLPDHPPVSFTWRGIRRRVKRADGPERVFGEWWTRDAELQAVRDYFRVEDEAGERYWIYRTGDGENVATGSQRWFLHGIFG